MTKKKFIEDCLDLANRLYGEGDIAPETRVNEYLDSLDFVEYIIAVEQLFSITIDEFLFKEAPHKTFGDVIEVFSKQMSFDLVGHDPDEVKFKAGPPTKSTAIYSQYPVAGEEAFPTPSKVRKVIYISGKVTGIESEAKVLFAKAQKELEAIGHEVINPMLLPDDHDKSWKSYMRVCIAALAEADCIYMLSNWANSRGAKIELEMASHLELDVLYETNM